MRTVYSSEVGSIIKNELATKNTEDRKESGTGSTRDKERTADYQTTMGLRQILENDGNEEELTAFMSDRNLPVDEIEARGVCH